MIENRVIPLLPAAVFCLFLIGGCGSVDDLFPSGADRRPLVEAGSVGNKPGQAMADITLPSTDGADFTLSRYLAGGPAASDAVVFYFTMWCPVCDQHMSHMRTQVIPNYPNVKFFIIDFVSGTVEESRTEQEKNFYTDMTVLVNNIPQDVLSLYEATMGTTVVIENDGSDGVVRMNEDYKDSVKLTTTLDALL